MQALVPIQTQGHNTAVAGFGYASNKHLHDWIVFHGQAETARQTILTDMDPKMRDMKPLQEDRRRVDLATYDEYERVLEQRMAVAVNHVTDWRRDPYREEFIHEDTYLRTY